MTHRSLLFVVPAMMVLGGCTTMIQLRVKPDPVSGNPVIDETYHDTAFVMPGDRIVWSCQCPPGTEFTVADLQFVGDLDELFEVFLPLPHGIGDPTKLASRIQELELLQRSLTVRERPAQPSEAAIEGPPPAQNALDDAVALLNKFKTALSPQEQRKLFKKDWTPPDREFVDGTKRIRSQARVAKGIGNGVWMFTWKVRRQGDGSEITWGAVPSVELDPHIVGHEETRD